MKSHHGTPVNKYFQERMWQKENERMINENRRELKGRAQEAKGGVKKRKQLIELLSNCSREDNPLDPALNN